MLARRRWRDLLIAEHHAHRLLREQGVGASESQLLLTDARAFLEVQRSDRIGARGRRGLVSLAAIDSAFYGRLDDWPAAAQRLERDDRLSAADLRSVRLHYAFAELTANIDCHFGNLAFHDDYSGRFALAPVYDMLPMLFAPRDEAPALATRYWRLLGEDPRISDDFRTIGAQCLQRLTA